MGNLLYKLRIYTFDHTDLIDLYIQFLKVFFFIQLAATSGAVSIVDTWKCKKKKGAHLRWAVQSIKWTDH